MIRLVVVALPSVSEFAWQLAIVLALLTMTLGNACALWQQNIRRMMAYSSIAHAGYLLIGISVMMIDLTIAGVIQGKLWQTSAPWLESIRVSGPYWLVRSLAAVPIAAGFILVLVGLTTGARGAGVHAIEQSLRDKPVDEVMPETRATEGAGGQPARAGRGLVMSYIVASIAGVGFFALSVSLLGAWPASVLAEQSAAMAPPNPLPPTAAEERGRLVYAREGCAYCHSQQIRYLEADIERFGAPTLAWETRFDYPHLMGTRRIGPDLSRAGGTRTENWHYVHLFAPRTVVPQSIMPSYAALFDGAPDRPTQAARDLVAYLESLGRPRELAWPEGDAAASAAAGDDRWARMSFEAPLLNAHPARTRPRGGAPELAENGSLGRGLALWTQNCSGCHGENGQGDGPAARWLTPAPTNLAARDYTLSRMSDILWNGVHGTAMPAWRDLSDDDRSAVAAQVASFAPRDDQSAPPSLVSQGADIYATHCAECHGDDGGGNGYAAADLPIMPTDFTGERPTLAEAVGILRRGVRGTSMAPWTDRLSDDEITAVAHYVRQFYGGSGGTGASP
jgi:cbb3-type cytochrome c oxidase subunit II